MATISFDQLLSAPFITRVISTIKTPMSRIQDFMGVGPAATAIGGGNVNPVGGHIAGWDIFDRTRTIATGRAPGVGPATTAPKTIGHVNATIYRAHEKISLLDERLFRTRPLGDNWGNLDQRGQRYVAKQTNFLAQRFRNNREFMVSRMLRGQFQLLNSGDNWIPVDSGGSLTVDFKVPAGNKLQLDMLGDGDIIGATWSAAGTDIVAHLYAINSAFEELHGRPLRHIWLNSTMWGYVQTNTGLKNLAGTANVVFDQFAVDPQRSIEGIPDTGFSFRLRGVPWITWHVYDGGLDVNGTFTKFFPDNFASFLPDPGPDWFEMIEGSEIVRENIMSPGSEQFGFHAWTEPSTQPAGFELIDVDNAIPALYVPKCVAWGTIVF